MPSSKIIKWYHLVKKHNQNTKNSPPLICLSYVTIPSRPSVTRRWPSAAAGRPWKTCPRSRHVAPTACPVVDEEPSEDVVGDARVEVAGARAELQEVHAYLAEC
jgi:hypothetical protein